MDRNTSKKSRRDRKTENQEKVADLTQDNQASQTLHTTTSDVDAATADLLQQDVDANTAGVVQRDVEIETTSKATETVDLDNQDLVFALAEEQLEADVYEKQIGTVQIAKRTEVLPVEGEIEVDHDEVEIEHRAVNEPVAEAEEPWYDGDTLVVPVYEEVLVTEKHLYLKEEIRITRVKTAEQVRIQDTVRRQVIDVNSDTARAVDEEVAPSPNS